MASSRSHESEKRNTCAEGFGIIDGDMKLEELIEKFSANAWLENRQGN